LNPSAKLASCDTSVRVFVDTSNNTLCATACYGRERKKRACGVPSHEHPLPPCGMAALLCLTMLWALCVFGCSPEPSPPADGGAAKASADQPKFEKIVDSTAADAKARVGRHMDLMISLSKSLMDFCPEQGRDLNEIMDLVEADFDAAKGALDKAQTEAMMTKYVTLSEAVGRCISDSEGRRFSQRLVSKLKPLTVPN